jgi:choline dehydrogenase-like flavoprotein
MNFDTDLFAHLRTQPPAFDADQLWYHFSKWSPRPNIREVYLPKIRDSERCTLLLHANVTDIALDGNLQRVQQLEVRSLRGHCATVKANAFAMCVGGIETARLLLASRKQRELGIGNEHDLVGRYFQDHPSALVGWIESPSPERAQNWLNVFHKRGLKYSVRCTATPQWQRENRSLNISMGTTFEQPDSSLQDLKDVYSALRRFQVSPETVAKTWRTLKRPSAAIVPAYQFLARGRSFAPGARMVVGLTSEQEPNPESRILLSEKVDALGMPRANVRWKLSPMTLDTMRKFAAVLREEFCKAGIGKIHFEPWLFDDSAPWMEHVTDQFHHIGTARMHRSPQEGVVNEHCQVHGMENLYIGSSAVFPTSGHSNPTLTIIALCLRLADRLKTDLPNRTPITV